jgi:hypothetical protein
MFPRLLVSTLAATALLPGVAAAQRDVASSAPEVSIVVQLIVGFLVTLLVGGLLVGAAPDYLDRIVDQTRGEPGVSVLWGIGVLALFIGLVFILAITVIGIVVVIPLVIAFAVVSVVATTIAYVSLVDGLVDSRGLAVVGAALVSTVVAAVPILGDIVGFFVSAAGLGAVAIDYRR